MKVKFSFSYIILSLLLISILSSTTHAVTALYDEQAGLSFTGTFTAIVYNVSAVAQSALSGTGPAYLINGYSNEGYWYQIGLSYDWVTNESNSHFIGFRANYEVFAPNGTGIYPSSGGSGVAELYGDVNPGDTVTLSLSINTSTGMVEMRVYDKTTGAYYDTEYPSYGATDFIGNSSSPSIGHGFFTGLMTEWYNVDETFGNQLQVLYQEYGTVQQSAYLWFDEFYCSDGYQCYSKQTIFYNATASPISNAYIFSADGFSEEYYNNGEDFETGLSAPATTTTIPSYSTIYTTSIPSTTIYTTSIIYTTIPTSTTSSTSSSTSTSSTTSLPTTTKSTTTISPSVQTHTSIFSSFVNSILNFFISLFRGYTTTTTTTTTSSTTTSTIPTITTSSTTTSTTTIRTTLSTSLTTTIPTTTIQQAPSCPAGYIYGTDGLCHAECGTSGTYCTGSSTCYNNQCLSCQSGYVLGIDGLCHQECGGSTTYCTGSNSYCYNNQCISCPSGDYLATNGYCYPYSESNSTPTTTIQSTGSGSCSSFELTESSPDSSTSGSCTWSGGYLTVSENEGTFVGLNVSIIGGSTGSSTSIYVPIYTYPSCQTIQHDEYLSAGTYDVYVTSGSSGIPCSNSHAYVQLSS